MSKERLLLVDDDAGILRSLRWSFDDYDVITAADRAEAVKAVREYRPKVVTLDLGLPPDPDSPSEGFKALEQILEIEPSTKVIVASGQDDRQNAIHSVGLGAYDFYQKPIDAEELGLIVRRAFNVADLEVENMRLRRAMETPLAGVITASDAMFKVCRTIEKVAPTDMNVLLLGESGTGKEVLSRALHRASPRRDEAFVAINCAAIPENLLESELFGHEKGAFTGAVKQVRGKIEMADKGTLFLDEIGDMPMPLQAKMLRFLEDRIVERVGGRQQIKVDVRIVAATNQNLQERIASSEFREDLFYRLSTITVNIPPLRDRADDAVVLASHFAEQWTGNQGKRALRLGPDAIAAIRGYNWPGNVRELENCIKRAMVMADGPMITREDLSFFGTSGSEEAGEDSGEFISLKEVRNRAEKEALINVVAATGGNLTEVARILGVSRPTIYNLLRQHGLKVDAASEQQT